jgi:hypothetical protein
VGEVDTNHGRTYLNGAPEPSPAEAAGHLAAGEDEQEVGREHAEADRVDRFHISATPVPSSLSDQPGSSSPFASFCQPRCLRSQPTEARWKVAVSS